MEKTTDIEFAEAALANAHDFNDLDDIRIWSALAQRIYDGLSAEEKAAHARRAARRVEE